MSTLRLTHLPQPRPVADDSTLAWVDFLSSYGRGEWSTESTIAQPPTQGSPSESYTSPLSSPSEAIHDVLYPSVIITPDIARNVRDYTLAEGYLPPPRSPQEALRLSCITEYDLDGDGQRANIQTALDLLAAFFPDTVCTFTLFRGRAQCFAGVSGPVHLQEQFQLVPDMLIRSDLGICGHAVLLDGELMHIPKLADDWRFKGNPYTTAGIKSYMGSPVSLQSDPLAAGQTISIGAINVLFVKDLLLSVSPPQAMVVRHITHLLQTQLRSTWDETRRSTEARYRQFVTDVIQEAFVGADVRERTAGKDLDQLSRTTVDKLAQMLDIDVAVIDVCCLFLDGDSGLYAVDPTAEPCRCIAQSSSFQLPDIASIASFLNNNASTARLETVKPLLSADTFQITLPFFILDRPAFIIVAKSKNPFNTTQAKVIESAGSILLARATQTRVTEADAAKDIFLSSISHELRTPLHSIMAALHIVDDIVKEKDWDDMPSVMAAIKSSCFALGNTLNDVLDFRPSKQFTSSRATEVELLSLVKETIMMVAEDREVVLEHEIRNWNVVVDAAHFQRILLNGLTNALKFSTDAVVVTLSATDHLRLVVADRGPGISNISRLLQPFQKQDLHTPGLGLGLHISKTLAESMGGTLSLESDKGTRFIFTLPITLPCFPTGMKRESVKQLSRPPTPISVERTGLRVMVIDDNQLCRRLLARNVSRSLTSTIVREYANGQEAVDAFIDFRPDIVFTDVSMPVMDGVTAAENMRAMTRERQIPSCKIYAITGLGGSDPRLQASGMMGTAALDGWLVKGRDDMAQVQALLRETHIERARA